MFELDFGFLSNTRNKSRWYIMSVMLVNWQVILYQVFDKMFI